MMRNIQNSSSDHERWVELSALATSGTLTPAEQSELEQHLLLCDECRQIFEEHRSITQEGIPLLSDEYALESEASNNWNQEKALAKAMAKLDRADHPRSSFIPHGIVAWSAAAAMAACILVAVGIIGFHLGTSRVSVPSAIISTKAEPQALLEKERDLQSKLDESASRMAELEATSTQKQSDITRLESEIQKRDIHASDLIAANNLSSEQIQSLIAERNSLQEQLKNAQTAYRLVQDELSQLKAHTDERLLHVADLENTVQRLNTQLHQQEQTIADRDQYLSSDRDIREIMGARQLYIADVYDIVNGGEARKPYGRLFYTKGKSLIFYAFDLDQQQHVRNASTFQVWGQRDFGHTKPLNLGVLYMDNESNRRWALRFDDPAKLRDVDAVFVTVEPHGGSQNPTGKPFLYASLHREPNHP